MNPVYRRVLLLMAFLPALPMGAQAIPTARDTVMTQEITRPLNTASMDDYLLDMAQATSVNVIADATDFPAESAVKPYPATSGAIEGLKGPYKDKWGNIFLNMMHEFAAQKKLSTLRSDDRTFLFWSEPEPHQLFASEWALTQATEAASFKAAVDDAKAKGLPGVDVISGPVTRIQLNNLLMRFLVNERGWDGVVDQKTPVDIETRLDDLSPGLRALVLLDLRHQFSRFDLYPLPADFWQQNNLHLQLQKDQPNRPGTAIIAEYETKEENGSSRHSFALATSYDEAQTPTQAAVTGDDPEAAPTQIIPLDAQDTLINAYTGLSDQATDPALDADTALAAPISLQVKRLSLRDLLTQLQQQSGVHFTLGEAAPADKLITAGVDKMPLARFMAVLSRVYGVKWSKGEDKGEVKEQGTSYVLRGNDQGELHLRLLQMGDLNSYSSTDELFFRPDRKHSSTMLAQAIIQQIGKDALSAPQGVPYTALTPELQQQVRHTIEAPRGRGDALMLYYVNRLLGEQLAKKGLVLRFGNADAKKFQSPYGGVGMAQPADELRFNVQSDDGQVVLPVFNNFSKSTRPAPPRPPLLMPPLGNIPAGPRHVATAFETETVAPPLTHTQ